jgi:Peptidase A4 family
MNSRKLPRIAATASAFLLLFAPIAARAQIGIAARQAYDAAGVVATGIAGVSSFRGPPAGFDAIHAADAEVALYGLPPRPNEQTDPVAYGHWARAMLRLGRAATAPLTDMHIVSRNLMPVGPPATGAAGGPNTVGSSNWSGVANTVAGLQKWNDETSVYLVASEFNVPVAEQAFVGAGYGCDGKWDLAANWNGIDGFSNTDVLQGGTLSAAYCKDGTQKTQYFAWTEWYPSYAILKAFDVNPGDDMYVETWDTSPTDGYVFVDDLTQGVFKTHHLKPKTKPYLVGNSAEYIVERPAGSHLSLYSLANYVHDYWAGGYAYTFGGTEYVPGSRSPTTFQIIMLNDQGTESISTVSTAGKYGLFFSDANCALGGGCVSSSNSP